jgi:hypothetical protein
VVADPLARPVAARRKRPVVVREARIVPARLEMAQEDERSHGRGG